MTRLLKDGISEEEFGTLRRAFIERWQGERLQDGTLARLFNLDAQFGRSRVQEDEHRRKVSALSREDLIELARQYLDLSSFSYFKTGTGDERQPGSQNGSGQLR
jgi:predicted Zn-dependent peptidase